MSQCICVPPSDIPSVMPAIAPMLQRATVRTRLGSFECIERLLLAGRSLLWLAWDGANIVACASTELSRYDGAGLVCTITACSGTDVRQWLPLISHIEDHAKREGCTAVRFLGRKGWLRLLPDYRAIGIIGEKTLRTRSVTYRPASYREAVRDVTP